ncbi:teneurin-m [Caerostris extrusa]|uniref:Teneurin-m n=1 Tax=Caerostris extrusa TaxID=172846 RepID=A0AAV4MCU8_CAEEX|nr:teneurin-m [Caerostris extrusa]
MSRVAVVLVGQKDRPGFLYVMISVWVEAAMNDTQRYDKRRGKNEGTHIILTNSSLSDCCARECAMPFQKGRHPRVNYFCRLFVFPLERLASEEGFRATPGNKLLHYLEPGTWYFSVINDDSTSVGISFLPSLARDVPTSCPNNCHHHGNCHLGSATAFLAI